MNPSLYIGLISGTSRDGVDAVLLGFERDRPVIRSTLCLPYPASLAERLERLVRFGKRPADEAMRRLDSEIAGHFADTALLLLRNAGLQANAVAAIGSHGQTVWHDPDGPRPESIQLGQPAAIAGQTGIATVGDFRQADIDAGGQGAPLAPLLHRALFRPERGRRIVLNLGGIANISIVDAQGGVTGFDTGPANCLLDAWIQRLSLVRRSTAAGTGQPVAKCDRELVQSLLRDSWFARPAPKSTGIEYFNLEWLQQRMPGPPLAARDVQATLAELTALTVTAAVRPHEPVDVLLCGGGVHNTDLVRRLRRHLRGTCRCARPAISASIPTGSKPCCSPGWRASAWPAGKQDTRAITGAREPVLLGSVAHPGGVE